MLPRDGGRSDPILETGTDEGVAVGGLLRFLVGEGRGRRHEESLLGAREGHARCDRWGSDEGV